MLCFVDMIVSGLNLGFEGVFIIVCFGLVLLGLFVFASLFVLVFMV